MGRRERKTAVPHCMRLAIGQSSIERQVIYMYPLRHSVTVCCTCHITFILFLLCWIIIINVLWWSGHLLLILRAYRFMHAMSERECSSPLIKWQNSNIEVHGISSAHVHVVTSCAYNASPAVRWGAFSRELVVLTTWRRSTMTLSCFTTRDHPHGGH